MDDYDEEKDHEGDEDSHLSKRKPTSKPGSQAHGKERVDEPPRKKRKEHIGEHGKERDDSVDEDGSSDNVAGGKPVFERRFPHHSRVHPLFHPPTDEGNNHEPIARRETVRERRLSHHSKVQWSPVQEFIHDSAPFAPIPLPNISKSVYADFTKSIEERTQEVLHRANEMGVPQDRALEISKRFELRMYNYMTLAAQETFTELKYYLNEAQAKLLAYGRRIGISTDKAVELVEKYNKQVVADREKREQETLDEMECLGAAQGALKETELDRTGLPDIEQASREFDTKEAVSGLHGPQSTQQSPRASGSFHNPLSPPSRLLSPSPHTPHTPQSRPRSSPPDDPSMIINRTPSVADSLTDEQRREKAIRIQGFLWEHFGHGSGSGLAADIARWRDVEDSLQNLWIERDGTGADHDIQELWMERGGTRENHGMSNDECRAKWVSFDKRRASATWLVHLAGAHLDIRSIQSIHKVGNSTMACPCGWGLRFTNSNSTAISSTSAMSTRLEGAATRLSAKFRQSSQKCP